MKILKLIGFFLTITFFNNAYTDEIINLYNDLYNLEQTLNKNQQTSFTLYKAKNILKNASPSLDACINRENQELLELNHKISFLNKIDLEPELVTLKKTKEFEYKQHLNKLYLCKYLNLQISNLNQRLTSIYLQFYLKDLVTHENNIYSFLTNLDQYHFKFSSTRDLVNEIAQYGNVLRYFRILLIGFFLLFFLNLQKKYRLPFIEKINVLKYAHTMCIYAITAPVFYLILHIILFQKNDILRSFFDRPAAYISISIYLIYLYKSVHSSSYKRDISLSIFLILINIVLFISECEITILRFSNNLNNYILPLKYTIFFLLQPMVVSVCYFCFRKILNIKITSNLIKISSLIIFFSILIIGLCGFLNLAIHLNLMIISDIVGMTWIIVFFKLWQLAFTELQNSKTKTYQFLQKKFHEQTLSAIFHIKILLTIMLAIFIMYDFTAIVYISNPFLKEDYILHTYSILFTQRTHGPFNFTLNSIGAALQLCVFFNIINIYTSSYFARKVYADPRSRFKTTKIFMSIGYVIIVLIIISISNIHIKNFAIISGGVLVAMGIALQSTVSKFFSSIVLYLHPPFELGDYIEIQNTKGFVKKITLLETHVETSDNNTIILPNQLISSTVLENFNYENKSFQKIHIYYILNELNINQEEPIKNKLRKILQMDSNVIKNEIQPIEFIFSLFSLSPDAYQLEIIFCYQNKSNLKVELTALNREIAICLKSMKLDAKFESMQFPTG